MIEVMIRGECFEIRPVAQTDLDAVLHVYQQCEDFLALGLLPRWKWSERIWRSHTKSMVFSAVSMQTMEK